MKNVIWNLFILFISGAQASDSESIGFKPYAFADAVIHEFANIETPLKLDVGLPKMIGKRLGLKLPWTERVDLVFIGPILRLFLAAPFLDELRALPRISSLTYETMTRSRVYLDEVPNEHKQGLKWLFEHEDGEVLPDIFLKKMVEIENGDVLKGMLLGWDILTAGWNDIFLHGEPKRNKYPFFKKFATIPHVQGDMFASYYHFWGAMIYSYILSKQSFNIPLIPETFISAIITVEELVLGLPKRLNAPTKILIRAEVDMMGVMAGSALAKKLIKLQKNRPEFISKPKPIYITNKKLVSERIHEQYLQLTKYHGEELKKLIKKFKNKICSIYFF